MKLESQSCFGKKFGSSATLVELPELGTTLTERSDIGCTLINCAVDMDAVAGRLEDSVGIALPRFAGKMTREQGRTAVWLTPRSWLIHCPVEEELELVQIVNSAFEDKLAHAALFTDYLCWMTLCGLQAQDLLVDGGFTSLEPGGLPVGSAKRTLLAGVSVIVVHERDQEWLLGIERSRARYFVDWLRAAAAARGCPSNGSLGTERR